VVRRPCGRCATAQRRVAAEQLDQAQYALGEGPCYDSSWRGQTLTSTNLADDEWWPRWAAEATALNIASILAVELTSVNDERLGSINTYWSRPRSFTTDDAAFISIFARQAALALAEAWKEDQLNTALDSRKLIGQAQGLLMERYDLDEAQAFEMLRRYSQDHNIKLRDVAAYLLATRKLPHPGRPPTAGRPRSPRELDTPGTTTPKIWPDPVARGERLCGEWWGWSAGTMR